MHSLYNNFLFVHLTLNLQLYYLYTKVTKKVIEKIILQRCIFKLNFNGYCYWDPPQSFQLHWSLHLQMAVSHQETAEFQRSYDLVSGHLLWLYWPTPQVSCFIAYLSSEMTDNCMWMASFTLLSNQFRLLSFSMILWLGCLCWYTKTLLIFTSSSSCVPGNWGGGSLHFSYVRRKWDTSHKRFAILEPLGDGGGSCDQDSVKSKLAQWRVALFISGEINFKHASLIGIPG